MMIPPLCKVTSSRLYLLLVGLALYVFFLTSFAEEKKVEANAPKVTDNTPEHDMTSSAFSQSLANKTSIPVEKGRFVVDSNVREIQILLTTDSPQTVQILAPNGKSFMPFKKGENFTWERIENLYAIKIPAPSEGQWEIQGKLLAQAQVLLTSDLEMITPSFPNNMIRGENFSLTAYLQEKGQRLTNSDFLRQTKFIAKFSNAATSEIYKIYLMPKANGVFRYDYHFDLLPGVYRLDMEAIGLLFQREKQQQFYVYDYPGVVSTKLSNFGDELEVQVHLFSPVLEIATCELSALIQHSDGSTESILIKKSAEDDWKINIPIDQGADMLSVVMAGYTKDARLVEVTFPKINIAQLFRESQLKHQQANEVKSRAFWRELLQEQVAYVIPVTEEKITEQILEEVSPFKGTDLMPLTHFPTYNQSLLDEWEPLIFSKGNQTQEKEALEAKANMEMKAKVQQKAKSHVPPPISPKRKLLIGIFSTLAILFLIFLILTIGLLLLPLTKRAAQAKSKAAEQPPAEQAPTEATVTEPAVTEPAVTEPAVTEPAATEPATSDQATAAPTGAEQTTAERTIASEASEAEKMEAAVAEELKALAAKEESKTSNEERPQTVEETQQLEDANSEATEVKTEPAELEKEASADKAKIEIENEMLAQTTEENLSEIAQAAVEETKIEMQSEAAQTEPENVAVDDKETEANNGQPETTIEPIPTPSEKPAEKSEGI